MFRRLVYIVLFSVIMFPAYSQKLISGRVMSYDSTGIPGVSVTVKGSSTGTITDSGGTYKLSIRQGDILVFSFAGLESIELHTDYQSSFDVKLQLIDEIVESAEMLPDEIPSFEFPPPKSSASCALPKEYFKSCRYLNKADTIIKKALEKAGYFGLTYYSVPNGFAMVTRMEKINEDGTSKKDPERWTLKKIPGFKIKIEDFFKILFFENKGYYRIIVFIITDKSFHTSDKSVSDKEAQAWLNSGNLTLPESIGEKKFNTRYQVNALIYEFIKTETSSETVLADPSNLNAIEHLGKSNILTWLR